MIVKKMPPEDLDLTVNLFGYYRDEAILSMPEIAEEYDENTVLNTIRSFNIKYNYVWFNAYDNSRPVGFIAGYLIPCPWSKRIQANIQFVYMLESHRSLENFKLLLNKFEEWAKIAGATKLTAGDIGIDIERSRKLYEYLGFDQKLAVSKDLA